MTSATNQPTMPNTVRRLDTAPARPLADLAAIFDDLQTVLRCCARLVDELAETSGEPDDLLLESLWTTAVLSYTRCFAGHGKDIRLSDEDVGKTRLQSELLESHKALRQLRKQYTDPRQNPREQFTVGATQDSEGRASGIAITSAAPPRLDDLTVRQTGALAYELSQLVDERIKEQQEQVRGAAENLSRAEMDKLPLIEVVQTEESGTSG